MRTNNKLMAMFLVGALAFCGLIVISDSESSEATDVTTEAEIQNAIANDDFSIVLLNDIKLTDKLSISKTGMIDLNGHVLEAPTSSSSAILVADANSGSDSTTIPTLTVKGDVEYSKLIGRMNLGTSNNKNANIVIDGGDYFVTSNTCLHVNGTCLNSSVTISNAEFYSSDDNAIQLSGKGTFVITDSMFTGATGIYIKTGALTMSGCAVTGTMSPVNYNYWGNGSYATGDGMVIDDCEYPGGSPTIKISDSLIEGTKAGIGFYEYEDAGKSLSHSSVVSLSSGYFYGSATYGGLSVAKVAGSTASISVTGGVFSSNPSAYVPEGYEAVLVSEYYYVGEQSTGGDVEVIETETAEDGTEVTTKTDMKVDDSGNVTRATVTVSTDDSVATATIGKSGTTTLSSTNEGTVYLTSESILTIMELSAQISGSDSMALNVVSSGSAVSIGSDAADYVSLGTISLSVTVNSGSSSEITISLNKNSLEPETAYMLSVEGNSAKASALTSAGLTGLTPFDLGLYVDDEETELSGSVTVSIPVQEQYDNMRLYCLDTGEFYSVSYSSGAVTATLPHFSTWAIVYDKPVVVVDDDDDILFILEQQKKAQEAASAQTTTEDNSGEEAAVVIAAAAVAGAMLACAFFAFRRP